jgi:hypothetical protein
MTKNSANRKKTLRVVLIAVLLMAVAGAGSLYYLRTSQSRVAVSFRAFARNVINSLTLPAEPDPYKGFTVEKTTFYINGKQADSFDRAPENADTKLVLENSRQARLFDRTTGFMADFPAGTAFSFGFSPGFVRAEGNGFTAVISREWAYEPDVTAYIRHYFNRFTQSPEFGAANGVAVLENVSDKRIELLTARLSNAPENGFDTYTYIFFKTDGLIFYRVMLKYNGDDPSIPGFITNLRRNFQFFAPKGDHAYNLDFKPVLPDNWTAETRGLYDAIARAETVKWGIFTRDVFENGIDAEIPRLEEQLETKFDIVLAYIHLNMDFPTEFMEKCAEQGRIVQLTYQLTTSNNLDLFGFSPTMHIYTGGVYDEIRQFARAAAEWGKPFLFRPGNEMNSDWTSYSGVINMSDPDIYIYVWRHIYRIFEEEGVNNAIWIYNPNDKDFPPAGWNDAHAYYPGNGYAHLFGITGYNTGTYYINVTGERWNSFYNIYSAIVRRHGETFGAFPWIITEFASSSVGGDKAQWILDMFDNLHHFPQIKAAVWFSLPDYDFRPEYRGVVSRPYLLDETPETLAAFRDGLAAYRRR